jgi:hypothetical protein
LAYLHLQSIVAPCILKFMALEARKGQKMTERENFIHARDRETDDRYLGTRWVRFHHFDVVEKTEDNVLVAARKHDPLADGKKGRSYPGEWLFADYNASDEYAPLRDEPDLFVKFVRLASKDPGTRDGRCDIMIEWIKNYGVLGLLPAGDFAPGLRSEREEHLFLFWYEVHRAARCMALYDAATGPGRMLKRSGLPGKTLVERRKSALLRLGSEVQHTLKRHCYPKLYFDVLEDRGEMTDVGLGWDFCSLLGAMYLQMAWRIASRRCDAPGCNNIIGLDKRSDAETCSKRCKERRKYHRNRVAAK